ncbi:glycosyltransferase family 4 protein [Undibacterium fentianense]|uniref:Glycosyltransferase family 4 protein n=1 Tax=Undibacterium fentianense TaxID=2828728 RepID=A0A941DXQ6_9BURK|nr:glycosyltransferase family 4 protein [Undibacterium fentianense]MBR7798710.1 glycosyltransferase family 4 protein [Undibacterium fentianense]
MDSLQTTHPDWNRHVLFVDRPDSSRHSDEATQPNNLYEPCWVDELPLPNKNAFLFRYGIMELNTAAKPYMFSQLRKKGYQRIIYIDPDILVLDRLVDVERLLDEGAAAVVTPHLTAPLNDDFAPSELEIMRAGSFNLGFLALGNQAESDAFIQWWEQKLEFGAVSDPSRGLFTDQKWVDLAPGMFGKFAILRDPGYNIAYWNLAHRNVTEINGRYFANGKPIRFFHFSGFDPLNPKPFSKHQNRFNLDTIGDAKKLALIYAEKVKNQGLVEARKCRYAFGEFSDGTPIPNALRVLYREDSEVRFQAGENPFEGASFFIHGESGDMPVILRAVWIEHAHLQKAFPNPLSTHRLAYYQWFTDHGAVEIGIPEIYVDPIRRALKSLAAEPNIVTLPPNYKASIWARGLVFLHKRATGGKISHARMNQYQQVNHAVDFLKLGYRQFRTSRWSRYLGLQRIEIHAPDPLKSASSQDLPTTYIPAKRNRQHQTKFSGLYFEEHQPAWWVGKQARFMIDQVSTPVCRIRGIHHGALCQQISGSDHLTLSIGFDDLTKQQIVVNDNEFDIELTLDQLPNKWPAILYLTPSLSFVPKQLGLNEDTRELSLQIRELQIGGQTIFNPSSQRESRQLAIPGINIIGYAKSEHGVGQSLRQFAQAVDAAQVPHVIIDFNRNNLSRTEDQSLDKRLVTDVEHGINVFHINADQMPEAEMQLPSHFFTRYNIGFWHWELPEMRIEHRAGFNQLDEVWVPTAFVQESIAKHSPVPVIRMPHAINFSISNKAHRAEFGLPEGKFLFLIMYDFSSYQDRKNPQAGLDAFEKAFGSGNDKAMLVIKTQNAQHHPEDMRILQTRLGHRHDIIWINETLSRQQVYDLQYVCDALISLHRAEGYGLGPAEAMFLGKPVIATNWSGNTEFMRQDNSLLVNYKLVKIENDIGVYQAGQTWAEADSNHAADLMQQLVSDPLLYEKISNAASRTMREEFSPAVIGKRIEDRLLYIQENMMKH